MAKGNGAQMVLGSGALSILICAGDKTSQSNWAATTVVSTPTRKGLTTLYHFEQTKGLNGDRDKLGFLLLHEAGPTVEIEFWSWLAEFVATITPDKDVPHHFSGVLEYSNEAELVSWNGGVGR